MQPLAIVATSLLVLLLGALLYWVLVLTEGTYLGPRVVVLLYDWTARRYDRIKQLRFVDESRYVGIPLVRALQTVPSPKILDVATGTGRVPLAVLREPSFGGSIVGVDRSSRMLAQALDACAGQDRLLLALQEATSLGFRRGTFDCVSCLEALEFFSDPQAALREFMRVLKPGGLLLVSNRVGLDAKYFVGRMAGRGVVESCLAEIGAWGVQMQRWQVHYDLVWARKPHDSQTARRLGS